MWFSPVCVPVVSDDSNAVSPQTVVNCTCCSHSLECSPQEITREIYGVLSFHKTIKLNEGILPKSPSSGMGGVVRGETYSVCPLDPSEWRVELYGESTAKKSLVLLPTWACSRTVWTTDGCFLKNSIMQADEMALWEKSLPPGLMA